MKKSGKMREQIVNCLKMYPKLNLLQIDSVF